MALLEAVLRAFDPGMSQTCVQGYGPGQSAVLAPACFGLAHVHHLGELTVHQGLTIAAAVPTVRPPRKCQPGQTLAV